MNLSSKNIVATFTVRRDLLSRFLTILDVDFQHVSLPLMVDLLNFDDPPCSLRLTVLAHTQRAPFIRSDPSCSLRPSVLTQTDPVSSNKE